MQGAATASSKTIDTPGIKGTRRKHKAPRRAAPRPLGRAAPPRRTSKSNSNCNRPTVSHGSLRPGSTRQQWKGEEPGGPCEGLPPAHPAAPQKASPPRSRATGLHNAHPGKGAAQPYHRTATRARDSASPRP